MVKSLFEQLTTVGTILTVTKQYRRKTSWIHYKPKKKQRNITGKEKWHAHNSMSLFYVFIGNMIISKKQTGCIYSIDFHCLYQPLKRGTGRCKIVNYFYLVQKLCNIQLAIRSK
jgi:hypothetical protein